MTDKDLDNLLEEIFDREVIANTKLVITARQKAEKQLQRKEYMKEYAPIIMMVIASTIISLLGGSIAFLWLRNTKILVAFLGCWMGTIQMPIIIFLLGIIYNKENKNQEV